MKNWDADQRITNHVISTNLKKNDEWNFVIMSGKKLKIGNLKEQEAETNFFRLL